VPAAVAAAGASVEAVASQSKRVLSSLGDKLSVRKSVFLRPFNSGASASDESVANGASAVSALDTNGGVGGGGEVHECGVTRSRTDEFVLVRRNDVKLQMDAREIDRVFNLYTMASFNKSSGSNAKSARLGAIRLLSDGQSDAKQCSKCGKTFGKLFDRRHNCNICAMAVCEACYSFTLPLVGALSKASNAAAVLKCCEDCHRMIHKYERRKTFRSSAEQRAQHPFSVFHGTISEVTSEIRVLLPEFQELASRTLSQAESDRAYADVVRIKKLCDDLQPLMSDFEHGLGVVAKLPIRSEADQKLARNVRQALVSLAQQWLPPWRMLCQQARRMPLPVDPVVAAALEAARRAEQEKLAAVQAKVPPPEILSIIPVLSALRGSRVLVQGDNFSTGIQVEIGGKLVPPAGVELRDVHHLLVQTPAFPDEGIRSIAVITANGHRHELTDALVYTKAFDGNSAAAIEQALKNEHDEHDDVLRAAAAAAEAATAAAAAAAAAAALAREDMTIASVDPSFTPLSGAPIVLRIENVAAVDGMQVRIAGRIVYHSAARSPNGDVRVECQAPRVDTEGFQRIEVKTADGRSCAFDNLFYAKVTAVATRKPAAPAAAVAPAAAAAAAAPKSGVIGMAELDDIDSFLDSLPSDGK
jgi:hypothetical protein